MRPLKAQEIRGSWATLLLPINEDQGIDGARLGAEIDTLIGTAPDGIYSNGTAGEFYTQTEDEFDRVSAMLAERCEAAHVAFQIGASHTSPQTTLARVRRAAALHPGAIQVILSDWFPLTDAEAVDYLRGLSDAAAGIGLVLYNPPHAKRVLAPPVFEKLCRDVPGLVGVKVADGPASWYAQMRRHAPGLSVFVPGHHLATGFVNGAAGAYSNVACLQPTGARRWWQLMQKDVVEALRIEREITSFFALHILPFITQEGYCNAACDKLLAAIGGWSTVGTRLRWPYRSIPLEEAERLRPLARAAIPELFA